MPSPPRRSPRAPLSLRVQEPHITPGTRNLLKGSRLAVCQSLGVFKRDRSEMLRKELRNSATISVPWLPIPYRPVPYHCHNTTRTPAREAASNLALWHCGDFFLIQKRRGGRVCKDREGRAVGPRVATTMPHCHKFSKQAAPRSKSKHHPPPRTGDQIPALREQKTAPSFPEAVYWKEPDQSLILRQIIRFALAFENISNDTLDPLPHPASLGEARNPINIVHPHIYRDR